MEEESEWHCDCYLQFLTQAVRAVASWQYTSMNRLPMLIAEMTMVADNLPTPERVNEKNYPVAILLYADVMTLRCSLQCCYNAIVLGYCTDVMSLLFNLINQARALLCRWVKVKRKTVTTQG